MNSIRPEFVDFIPASLAPGVLYISERYRTASHLCPCGCGQKVVTPLSAADWHLVREGDRVSLHPSIGNWKYACRSHYWIKQNRVVWSGGMSEERIARVQERDRLDKLRHVDQRNGQKLEASADPRLGSSAVEKTSESRWARFWSRVARLLGLP